MAGVINKIRSKGAIVVTVVGVALASFILSDLLQNIYRVYQGDDTPDVLAKIGDKRIKAEEFKNLVEQQLYLSELSGNPNADREQIAGQVWEQTVGEAIYDKEFEKLGLKVTDSEFKDMLVGKEPDPDAIRVFQSVENMRDVLQKSEKDPVMKFRLTMAEKFLVRNRLTNKYNSLIKNGIFVSKAEAKRKMEEERKTAKIEFVAVSYSALADKDFKPTDSDYNEVYNEYKEEFKLKAPEAVLTYVAIPKAATKRDTLAGYQYLNGIKADFAKSPDDSSFAASRNKSAQNFDFTYKNRSELDPKEADLLAGAKKDSVYGPFLSGKVLKLIKINGVTRNDTAPFVKIRHILLQPSPGDTVTAYTDYMALRATVTKENFAMKVMEKSADQRTKMNGGELGWYRFGSFGPNTELDKMLKKAPKGQIFGAKSAAGYHIVEVLDRSNEGIRLATVGFDMEPGKETTDSLMNIADRLRMEAGTDTAKFSKLAKAKKLIPKMSQPIAPGAGFVDGLGGGTVKTLIGWALTKDGGDFFDRTYDSDNMILAGYVASKVTEGYKPMALVKNALKDRVMARLKTKKIKDKLAAAAKGQTDLDKIQTSYGAGAFKNSAEGVSFASGYITGMGQEPAVAGKLFKLKPGQVSAPIAGKSGVYVVKVIEFADVPKQDDKAIEEYRISLQANRRGQFPNKIQQGLRDFANVKDYRYKHGF